MFGKAALVNALVSAVSAGMFELDSSSYFRNLTFARHDLVGWTLQRDELVRRSRKVVLGQSGWQLPVLHPWIR